MPCSSARKTARQFGVNVLSGPLLRAASAAIAMAAYAAYLRELGAERYGLWLVLSIVLMMSQLGSIGIGEALAKVVAEEHAAGNALGVRQYSTTVAAALAGSGAVVCLALWVWRSSVAHALGVGAADAILARSLLPYCAAVSVCALLADAQANVLAGLGRMDLVNGLQVLTQAIAVGGGVWLLRCGWGIPGLLAAAFLSRVTQHGIATLLVARTLGEPVFSTSRISGDRFRRLVSLSGSLFAGGAVNLLLAPLNRVVVARCAGLEMVPVYEIAYNGSMQIRALLVAGVRPLLPEVSRLAADAPSTARAAVRRLTGRAVAVLVVAGAPLYAGLFAASGPLLRLWLGGNLHAGQQSAFRIMLAGSLLSLLGTVPYYSLLGLHRGREVLCGYLAQSAVNAAGIAALWRWSSVDVFGVLWAASAGMAVSTAYLAWAHRQALSALEPRLPTPYAVPPLHANSRTIA